ncbi:MAG: acetyltransferase [Polyangiaceae bacterium]|nr:acetyltransferase [Polyangiaceae bacterium]
MSVIGAGGHAKVIVGLLHALGARIEACFDDDATKRGQQILGVPIRSLTELPTEALAVLAIGNNRTRQRLARELPCVWASLVHPTAFVDPSSLIGPGSVVFAGAVIQPDVVVGAHAIVNTAASIDHDGNVGDFVHVAPGCHLAGTVTIDEGAFLGVGVSVVPGRRVGAWATVGAGACVIRDIAPGITVVGVPARPIVASNRGEVTR